MVDLPSGATPITTTEVPRSNVSAAQIASPYHQLAEAMDKGGEALDAVAVPLAEQAAYKAVTRDATGEIQVEHAPIVGPAMVAYSRAVKMGALTEGEGAAKRGDIALRQQYRDDPEGYLKAAEEFRGTLQGKYSAAAGPEVGMALSKAVDQVTTQTYRGLLNEKERLDLARAKGDMDAGITSASEDMMTLARGGDTSSDAFKQASAKWDALTGEKLNNPRLAYTADQAAYDRQNVDSLVRGQGILHHVDEIYNDQSENGGRENAMVAAKSILTDDSLKLSQVQREHFYNKAMGEIRANDAQKRQDVAEVRADATELRSRSALGQKIDPSEIDEISDRYAKAGATAQRASFLAAAARMPLNDEYGRQPIAEQTHQLMAVKGAAAAHEAFDFYTKQLGYAPEHAAAIVGHLVHESGLDPTITHDGGIGLGVAGWNKERLQRLQDFAKERGTAVTDRETQYRFVDRELRGVDGKPGAENAAYQKLLASKSPEEAATALMDYERPQGWTPQNPTAGMGYASRVSLARTIYQGGDISTQQSPAGAQWLAANRGRQLDKAAWAQVGQIEKDWQESKMRPSDKAVNDLTDAARATNNFTLLDHLSSVVSKIDYVQGASQQPLPAQAANIADLKQKGESGQLDPGAAPWIKDLEAKKAAIEKGLKEDAPSVASANFPERFKALPPLDMKNDQNLAAGLQERGRRAQFLAGNYQTPPLSALGKDDLDAIKGVLDTPDVGAKTKVFSMLAANLPEDTLKATLAKLGEKGPTMMVSSGAGALLKESPDVATSILRGQQAILTNKGYLPTGVTTGEETVKGSSASKDWTAGLNKSLPLDAFPLSSRADPRGAYATMDGMIKARYADLSAQANDASGKFNDGRLKQAGDDVTGGIGSHNGGNFIMPTRGMNQRQFDGVLWGLTDKDLSGVSTANGSPINADTLRQGARLEGIGQGRYLVNFSKDSSKPPIYAFQGANTEAPRPFVLDLRGRPGGKQSVDVLASAQSP